MITMSKLCVDQVLVTVACAWYCYPLTVHVTRQRIAAPNIRKRNRT